MSTVVRFPMLPFDLINLTIRQCLCIPSTLHNLYVSDLILYRTIGRACVPYIICSYWHVIRVDSSCIVETHIEAFDPVIYILA